MNVAFQQSAHKVLLDDDNLLPLLHLTIEYHGKEHKGLPLFCIFPLLLGIISSPISASIHLHRNPVILDLKHHVVWCPKVTQKEGECREAERARPWFWFWFL